jgi:cyclic AMP-dependent transcription factor ATF-4
MEPESPNSPFLASQSNYIEELLFEDNFTDDLLINELNNFNSKKSVEDILWELDNGKTLDIVDEFPLVTDNKVTLPIYDYLSPGSNEGYQSPEQTVESSLSIIAKDEKRKTEELLMEFDTIYDAVELNHLTPPQTPPGHFSQTTEHQEKHLEQVLLTILNENQYVQPVDTTQIVYQPQSNNNNNNNNNNNQHSYVFNQNIMETVTSNLADHEMSIIFDNNSEPHNVTHSADITTTTTSTTVLVPIKEAQEQQKILREIEVVDELVRSRAKDLLDDDEEYSSGISSVSSSPRSDETSSNSGYSQDDEDWDRAEITKKSTSRIGAPLAGVTKKRTRPYIKGSEDKKSRKKEQNKNAATRYRQKKKQEIEVILDEEKILLEKHHKLYSEYKDKKRELSYLKNLLKELFKAKGLL